MIEIKKLNELHRDELSAYLNDYQETTMFIRNNLYYSGITYQGTPFHGEYYGSFEKHQLSGVLVHYWNGNIMMQAENPSILSALVDAFKLNRTRPIAGVLGEDSQASFVLDKLNLQSPSLFAVNYQEKLFLLNLEKMIIPAAIHTYNHALKSVQDCPIEVIKEWLIAYHIEALGDDVNNPKLEDSIINEIQDKQLSQNRWVLFVNNLPVSLCGFNANLPDIVQLGPVYTPLSSRNNGFARIAVYLCLKHAAMNGVKRAILFTNEHSAIRAYKSLGFQEIGKYRLAIFKK
ncbi:GNAT family N-acetyltransferase [Legionella longbeachae]|uniref:Putative acetyltransferase, GNAT family n=1 Tax=Legionella longbeachae serogroup 1 (strain NSW150) TaxID=661367 RepID=D3HQ46_LEGLN|nr:GNAT family N-acetyltransferase [Legionella longbeachae]HBD7396292.1 N-acetyltransferase [Legionella pneumophila]ARB92116.1 N-acetyltransferase [Legionella longbeachae]ARM34705.1 N-acetyltransferase [Legionella longbeachae]QIN31467.1 N-acetyltransferase [Legionella longbeachae]QIN34813.1 N-acetyltransferase [Legionella longbeachae]